MWRWRKGKPQEGDDTRPPGQPRPRRRRLVYRIALALLLTLVIGLVAARLALPSWLQSYVNRTLDQSPEYDGRVGEIDVHLWRGAYTIHDLEIVKTSNSVPVPFFESPRVDLAIDWHALTQGMARGRIVMDKPKLNFVHGPSPDDTQTGANQPWLAIIDDLYPFRIDRARIRDGQIHFRAFHTRPPVNVFLSDVQATLTNLTNVEDSVDPLIADVRAEGTAMESGHFEFTMSLDPQAHRPDFTLAARLLDMDVTRLRDLTRAYGDFDFEAGRFDLVVEATTKDGFLDGYAKPLFRGLRVISLRELETDDPLQVLWESLVGLVGQVFENQPRDQFGTRITLEGDLDDPRTNMLEIVGNVLRNAFVRAYLPSLEGRVAPEVAATDEARDDSRWDPDDPDPFDPP